MGRLHARAKDKFAPDVLGVAVWVVGPVKVLPMNTVTLFLKVWMKYKSFQTCEHVCKGMPVAGTAQS